MTPTPEQEAVFDSVANLASHLCIEAVAGSGKTTTAEKAARLAKGRVGFVAFNSHIAQELKRRLNGCADASTLHSLGYRAVLKAFPGAEVVEKKAELLLGKMEPGWFFTGRNGRSIPRDVAKATLHLAKLCKYTLADESCVDDLAELVEHYGVEMPNDVHPDHVLFTVPQLLAACEQDTETVDFDDQVWMPVRKNLAVGEYGTLFVDEAQDLSRVQQTLARKAGERLVIVGDRAQAIYGFAGSDCDALPRLASELDGCQSRPLTVTFRCPQSHVSLARQLVPQIQAAGQAVSGIVRCIEPRDVRWELLPGDLGICRCNAPITEAVYLAHEGDRPSRSPQRRREHVPGTRRPGGVPRRPRLAIRLDQRADRLPGRAVQRRPGRKQGRAVQRSPCEGPGSWAGRGNRSGEAAPGPQGSAGVGTAAGIEPVLYRRHPRQT